MIFNYYESYFNMWRNFNTYSYNFFNSFSRRMDSFLMNVLFFYTNNIIMKKNLKKLLINLKYV